MDEMKFIYENWKGVKSLRTVHNPIFWKGESKYHKGEQWFIRAFDLDRQDFRDFAVADILTFVTDQEGNK